MGFFFTNVMCNWSDLPEINPRYATGDHITTTYVFNVELNAYTIHQIMFNYTIIVSSKVSAARGGKRIKRTFGLIYIDRHENFKSTACSKKHLSDEIRVGFLSIFSFTAVGPATGRSFDFQTTKKASR